MKSLLSIGDMAKTNYISVQTLRYYHSIGLLYPVFIDEETNYRYYSIEQSATIEIIQLLQELGFSLSAIKELLQDHRNLEYIIAVARQREEALILEREAISRRIDKTRQFIQSNQDYRGNKGKSELEIVEFPERLVYRYHLQDNIYEMSDSEYEMQLSLFKQHLTLNNHPVAYFNRVGTIMPEASFKDKSFISKEMFIFSSKKIENEDSPFWVSLPRGSYAVYYCKSFQDEINSLETMYDLINERNLQVCGDYICEVIYEFPNFETNSRDMFIRMQIPVKV